MIGRTEYGSLFLMRCIARQDREAMQLLLNGNDTNSQILKILLEQGFVLTVLMRNESNVYLTDSGWKYLAQLESKRYRHGG